MYLHLREGFHTRVKCTIPMIIRVIVILMMVIRPAFTKIIITKANLNCAIQNDGPEGFSSDASLKSCIKIAV